MTEISKAKDIEFKITITREKGGYPDIRRQIELETDPKCKAWIWIIQVTTDNQDRPVREFTPAPQGIMFDSRKSALLDLNNFLPTLADHLDSVFPK
jgi:hypothetical protein